MFIHRERLPFTFMIDRVLCLYSDTQYSPGDTLYSIINVGNVNKDKTFTQEHKGRSSMSAMPT